MLSTANLKKFALVTLKVGVNLQKGQGLEIICPVEKSQVAEALTEQAYLMGASIVRIRWSCDKTERLNYLYAEKETLCDIPKWFVDSKNDLIKRNFCYVAISADDPTAFSDVPADKISATSQAKSKALKSFFNTVTKNGIRWCVTSVPTLGWAKMMFPASPNPEKELGDLMLKIMRLDCPDPVKAWEKHLFDLDRHAQFLNDNDFNYLHFTSSNGTDLKVGLATNHLWLSAQEKALDGVPFIANLPTEEVFTAPHRLNVEGIVYAVKPLNLNGKIVDGFWLQFKKGKVVNYDAQQGYEALKGLIETDKGTLRIGEVALIGKSSPIAKSGLLFYNTLFDENASCHLALGKAYPTTIKGGQDLSGADLKKLGANDSIEHEDFMIGAPDMKVVGVKKDGSQVLVFNDGDWVI